MTWNPALRWLAAILLAAAASAQETPPPVPPGGLPIPPVDLELPLILLEVDDPVAAARAQNDRAYRDYLHLREILIARGHAGRWVAILDGQILPRAGGEVVPVDSIEALHFLVDPGHEGARHRYFFRIGEEGDVAYHYYAPNLPGSDALGVGLFRATFLGEPESDVVFAPDRVYAKRGARRHDWAYGEKGIALDLADPTARPTVRAIVTPSSACDGTFVLSSETAASLGLERFEIPGVCWYGPEDGERVACRRARLRWRVPELDLDATIPVAVWPRRPANAPGAVR
jgi:hypothetical protein